VKKKAAQIYPRPVTGLLRPIVRCPTAKYNSKLRYGRGFTLQELRAAKIDPQRARGIGIAIDYRRKNTTDESLQANVQRLQLYQSKLVVFPKKSTKLEERQKYRELVNTSEQQTKPLSFKVVDHKDKKKTITKEQMGQSAYLTLRKERAKARRVGLPLRKEREKTKPPAGQQQSKKQKQQDE